MRQVDDAVAGERAERHEQNEKNTREKFHGRNVTREFSSATGSLRGGSRSPSSMLILRSRRLPNCNIARGAADPPQAGKTAGNAKCEFAMNQESKKTGTQMISIWRP